MARQRRNTQEEPKPEEQETARENERGDKRKISTHNLQALLIGLVGAAITLGAYSQTMISPTQCVTIGLLVLFFGLLVGEGLISL